MLQGKPAQEDEAGTRLVAKTSHNAETLFNCPQAFLSLDFHCRDDVFRIKQTVGIHKSYLIPQMYSIRSRHF